MSPDPIEFSSAGTESAFYAPYEWCLNPIVPLSQLLKRCSEELEHLASVGEAWQARECRINVYLMTCAVSCTTDDYLSPGFPSLAPLTNRFPKMQRIVRLVESALHGAHSVRNRMLDNRVHRWKLLWDRCVELACEVLVRQAEADTVIVRELSKHLRECASATLPEALLQAQTQLPSGFRAQDLSHYDVLRLTEEFMDTRKSGSQPVDIIGARTAGSYFAPLAAVRLAIAGWPSVSWTSVRPKSGLSAWEAQKLRAIGRGTGSVVIVDDHPDTGKTIGLMLTLLRRFGIAQERVTIMVPRHPAQKNPAVLSGGSGVEVVTEPWERAHKSEYLNSGAHSLLSDYLSRQGWSDIRVEEEPETTLLNQRLSESCGDGFYVRLKKVFFLSGRVGQNRVHCRVIGKSVGWGWLGYHAYIAGTRLEGSVPSVLGLREGILFSEWLGGVGTDVLASRCEPTISEVAQYVARRAELLRIDEDPCFEGWKYGLTGWYALIRTLRAPYGPYLSRFKVPALQRALRKYVPRSPAFIDARMRPEEWIRTAQGVRKVDYEHHGFGNPALNVVDPAYDLAAAVFDLGLDKEAETELIREYQELRSDPDVRDRLILLKLVCGRVAQEAAAYKLTHTSSHEERQVAERSRIAARDFLVYQMNQFFADRLPAPWPARWSEHMVFLDLDGVFDRDRFYFPHTTPTGMLALRRLQAGGYSVVLNSGRSMQHIRNYCSSYSLCGGIAEYGCSFFDAFANKEHSLVPEQARKQIDQFRTAVSTKEGLFNDPTYAYAVRIYRMQGSKTVGLAADEISALLKDFDQLSFLTTSEDTYILPRGASKAVGVTALKNHLKDRVKLSAAVGNSKDDFPMFGLVDRAYFLPNGSRRLRRTAVGTKIHVINKHFQVGLLEAANDLLHYVPESQIARAPRSLRCYPIASHVIEEVLLACERPWWRQLWAAVAWRNLLGHNIVESDPNQEAKGAAIPITQREQGVRAAVAPNAIEELKEIWQRFPVPSPMQSYAWAHSCAEVFTQGELKLLTVGNPVTGVAAFFRRDGRAALSPLGAELYEPSDCSLNSPASAPALAEAIVQLNSPLVLGDVFADSPMLSALQEACRWRRLMIVRPRRGHPYLPLDKSWLEPESHLNSGRRSDLRRARRNAEKLGTLRCEIVIPTLDELPSLLEQAFQVEAANWKGAQGSALATDPLVGGFYWRYAAAACELGQLRLGFLRLGGRAVAMQIAVEHAGRFWLLKMGFNQEVTRCAPGQLLMIESLRFAAGRKCEVYEILGTSEPWNQIWTQLVHPAVSVRIYRAGVRGAVDAAFDFCRARLSRKS